MMCMVYLGGSWTYSWYCGCLEWSNDYSHLNLEQVPLILNIFGTNGNDECFCGWELQITKVIEFKKKCMCILNLLIQPFTLIRETVNEIALAIIEI